MPGSSSDFIFESRERGVGLKSAVLEYAARERGLKVDRFDSKVIVAESSNVPPQVFREMNGPLSSVAGRAICDHKYHSRRILDAAGIPVTPSRAFRRGQRTAAYRYARSLGGPVVLKPTSRSRGRGITTGIDTGTEDEFAAAWRKVISESKRPSRAEFIVEKHIVGEDYRVFVVGGKVFSATHRRRASVTGDGVSTVAELIDQKNSARAEHPTLLDYLIPTDLVSLDRLTRRGYTLETVPGQDEQVTLRSTSNLSGGGDSIDVTEHMHPQLRRIAQNAVAAIPGMEYAGVDLITPSISNPPAAENVVVSEIEYSPAPVTNFPVEGVPRDMAGAVVDFYLQQNRKRRLTRR